MIRRRYYGWLRDDRFYLSLKPPDAPTRPCVSLETVDDVKALLMRRGVEIYWWPPLPDQIDAQIKNGLCLEGGR